MAGSPYRSGLTKRLFLLMMAACAFFLMFPAALRAQKGKLEINRLTGNFYIYTTYQVYGGAPFPSNSMYVVTDSGVVMIDTPWDEEQTAPLLDSIERRHGKAVVMCISTHSHADRTAGLDVLKARGIRTYSTEHTWRLCREHGEKEAEFHLKADTTFTVGGVSFQTYYPGAGHAPDNIIVWFPKARVLYGGCFVKSTESYGLGNVADANLEQWPIAVRNVMKKFSKPAFIIPGHQDWSSRNSLKHTLKLLKADKRTKKR
jgi:glyoxylase-like metal-dependent hydrolase (beta-lactamase superfamily II)